MKNLTCFIISPIAEEGSEIRKHSDDLLDLIIEPALEKHNFEIIRADKLLTVSSITKDIITLVQNSDLCIIDLTGKNANVMYELGRRHESGKPFILLAEKGEELPFDITMIRTIFYDLLNPRAIRDTVKKIQKFIDEQLKGGFSPESSGESLTSIAETLRRIERSVESLNHVSIQNNLFDELSGNVEDLLKKLTLDEAFKFALNEGNIDLAEQLLTRIQPRKSRDVFYRLIVAPLAMQGSIKANNILLDNYEYLHSTSIDQYISIIGSMVTCFARHDREEEGLEFFNDKIDERFEEGISNEEKASLLTQKQRLLHGMNKYVECIQIGEQVIELCPNEPSYYYNQSLSYEALGDNENAAKFIDKCIQIKDPEYDDDHISQAIDIYRRVGNKVKELEYLELLKQINPYKYRLKR